MAYMKFGRFVIPLENQNPIPNAKATNTLKKSYLVMRNTIFFLMVISVINFVLKF